MFSRLNLRWLSFFFFYHAIRTQVFIMPILMRTHISIRACNSMHYNKASPVAEMADFNKKGTLYEYILS